MTFKFFFTTFGVILCICIRYWALMAIRIKTQDNQHDRGIGVRQAIPRFALFTANPAIVLPTTNNIPQNLQVPSNKNRSAKSN